MIRNEKCGEGFYSGYTDRVKEGTFVDINTGQKQVFSNWADGEPDNA